MELLCYDDRDMVIVSKKSLAKDGCVNVLEVKVRLRVEYICLFLICAKGLVSQHSCHTPLNTHLLMHFLFD